VSGPEAQTELARAFAVIRRYLVWQHRWTGLLMTVFLIAIGLSGSLLVYRVPLDRMLNPQLFALVHSDRPSLSLSDLAVAAEQAEPRARVAYLANYIPGHAEIECAPRIDPAVHRPYNLDFDRLVLDPATGRVLGRRREGDWSHLRLNALSIVNSVHTSLAAGPLGSAIVGYVGIVWTIDCFVGFILTLPAGSNGFFQRWRVAWQLRFRSGTFRALFDIHRAGGLWLWPLLFMFAWSGVMLSNMPIYDKVTGALFDYSSDLDFVMHYPVHEIQHPKLDWKAAERRGEQLMRQVAAKRAGSSRGHSPSATSRNSESTPTM